MVVWGQDFVPCKGARERAVPQFYPDGIVVSRAREGGMGRNITDSGTGLSHEGAGRLCSWGCGWQGTVGRDFPGRQGISQR
jgi:hypothetical protein